MATFGDGLIARVAALRPIEAVRQAKWRRQRLRPPRCPRGWHTGPPDFVGVGVQKAGTSWWYQLIGRHPDVVTRGHPKELDYFRRAPGPAYELWFPRPPGKLAGEWTPDYISDPEHIRRLAVAAPDTRVLVMLRDPVERYVSGLTMALNRGWAEPEPEVYRRGFYASALEVVLRSFERVLVLQYERCVADTHAELARTYRFLGLDDSYVPAFAERRVHLTITPKVDVPTARREELIAEYTPDVARAAELVPDLDLSLWPNF